MGALTVERQRHIARSFARAATTYDEAADLQRAVGRALLESVRTLPGSPLILDLGAGTGFFSSVMSSRFPKATLIAVDLAMEMLKVARDRFSGPCLQADAARLPLRSAQVDLVFSNLCLQWCPSLAAVLGELRRLIRPGGTLVFSSLGPQTLEELRSAWSHVDSYPHVIDFHDVDTLVEIINKSGFELCHLEIQLIQRVYPDVLALLRELKQLGARNASLGRSIHLTGPKRLAAMMAFYADSFGCREGGVFASFEVITVRCRVP